MNEDFSLGCATITTAMAAGWIWRRPSKCCNTWRGLAPPGDAAHGRLSWRGAHHPSRSKMLFIPA
jgi:hypothetical protein